MATIFYGRKGSQADNIASSREIAVEDIINLYGSEPGKYNYMEGADSPAGETGKGPASHTVVKIEPNEVKQDTFPEPGFYIVQEA